MTTRARATEQERRGPGAPRRLALVVGAPLGDDDFCEAVRHSALRAACFFRQEAFETRVILDAEASRDGILEGLRWLRARARVFGDVAVFYYAGHGYLVEDLDEHERSEGRAPAFHQMIVPVDFLDSTPGDFRGILGVELGEQLEAIARVTDNVTVILDCCHAAQNVRDAGKLNEAEVRALLQRSGELVHRQRGLPHYLERAPPPRSTQGGIARLLASTTDQRSYPVQLADSSWALLFSDTLFTVLDLPGARAWSWESILALTRKRVWERRPEQRPDVAGERYRVPFARETARLPANLFFAVCEGARVELPYATFLSVQVGDEFELLEVSAEGASAEAGAVVGRARCERADVSEVVLRSSSADPARPLPAVMYARGPALRPEARWSRLRERLESCRVDASGHGYEIRWGVIRDGGEEALETGVVAKLRHLDQVYVSTQNRSSYTNWHCAVLRVDHHLQVHHWTLVDSSGVLVIPGTTRFLTAGPYDECSGIEIRCDGDQGAEPREERLLVLLANGPFAAQSLDTTRPPLGEAPLHFGDAPTTMVRADRLRVVELRYRLHRRLPRVDKPHRT